MSITAITHLNFHGNARQALEFYQTVFGGTLIVRTYGDFGAPQATPLANQVVWGQVVADSGFQLMAYDVPTPAAAPAAQPTTYREHGMTITQAPFFIALRGEQPNELLELWERLAVEATIIEPIAQSPWAQLFGMLTDRFGVTWSFDVA